MQKTKMELQKIEKIKIMKKIETEWQEGMKNETILKHKC
jgi:hypothetical protein